MNTLTASLQLSQHVNRLREQELDQRSLVGSTFDKFSCSPRTYKKKLCVFAKQYYFTCAIPTDSSNLSLLVVTQILVTGNI